ncbi:MAG: hypothetical protein IJS65_05465 [Clostridia bacterium]|nr:hypothetical protein [Clostridia bacterium]
MKKYLSLFLALIMVVALFTACGKKAAEEPTAATPDEPLTPEQTTVLGTIDKTDLYTLVIEEVGASGDDRTGARAAEGKIEVGFYNAAGTARVKGIEFDWAELGLEGEPWEYLGAVVEVDESGEKAKIVSVPDKCTFCVKSDELKFDEAANTVSFGEQTFSIPDLNYGWLRTKTLLNEGGQYIPKWNDHSVTSPSSSLFTSEKYAGSYYFFVKCDLLDQTLIANYEDAQTADKVLPTGIAPIE